MWPVNYVQQRTSLTRPFYFSIRGGGVGCDADECYSVTLQLHIQQSCCSARHASSEFRCDSKRNSPAALRAAYLTARECYMAYTRPVYIYVALVDELSNVLMRLQGHCSQPHPSWCECCCRPRHRTVCCVVAVQRSNCPW
jgi:hypothetical protein